MALLDGIKHVSFDLWLTLIKSNPEFKPLRNQLFSRFFGVQKQEPEVTKAFRHFDQLFNLINEKAGGNVHYTEMLYVILDHLGVPVGQVEAGTMDDYYKEMERLFYNYHPQLIEPHTATILQSLVEKECSINILSNTGFILGKTLRPLLQSLDLEHYFSFQLYSDEMGNSKPSLKVYEKVFIESNRIKILEKGHILHIGDNKIADVEGAEKFGFRSAIIDGDHALRNLFLN